MKNDEYSVFVKKIRSDEDKWELLMPKMFGIVALVYLILLPFAFFNLTGYVLLATVFSVVGWVVLLAEAFYYAFPSRIHRNWVVFEEIKILDRKRFRKWLKKNYGIKLGKNHYVVDLIPQAGLLGLNDNANYYSFTVDGIIYQLKKTADDGVQLFTVNITPAVPIS